MGSPKYMQVMEWLQNQCAEMEPHSPIDSEREIAAKLSISRMTVRKAVEELCRQGVLYRDGNRGTFVSALKPEKTPPSQPERRRILFVDSVYDGSNVQEVQKALRLPEHERLFRLVRLVLCQQTPLRVEEIYAAEHDVSDEELGSLDSFCNLEQFRLNGRTSAHLEPMLVPAKYARLLQLRQNVPIIRKDELICRHEGTPYFFVQTYYNPQTSPLSA